MALPRGQGHPKMLPLPPADLRPISLRPFGSDLKRSKMAPRGLRATFFRLQRPPRALQEPFQRLPAAIMQLSDNPMPFYIDFDSQKAALGSQQSMTSIKKKTVLDQYHLSLLITKELSRSFSSKYTVQQLCVPSFSCVFFPWVHYPGNVSKVSLKALH